MESASDKELSEMVATTSNVIKTPYMFSESEDSDTSSDYTAALMEAKVKNFGLLELLTSDAPAHIRNVSKGILIQPHGCVLVIDQHTYKVIAYSKNTPQMLSMLSDNVATDHDASLYFGVDLECILDDRSTADIRKAFLSDSDSWFENPVFVRCKNSGKPFYAVVQNLKSHMTISFEPVTSNGDEAPVVDCGQMYSYRLAAKAIKRLQSVCKENMQKLCDTMVHEIFELTGYDRVMAYKFHDDDHSEVISEIIKPGLEPFLGFHYDATGLPLFARYVISTIRVHMICDCRANNVKVLQNQERPDGMAVSTLRAPNRCHQLYMEKMNLIASLVLPVSNEKTDDAPGQMDRNFWGLVVCYHTSPKFVPYPLRIACKLLTQVFSVHVEQQSKLENLILERSIVHKLTLLCYMMHPNAPFGVVSYSPNIKNLVECDGTALLYKNELYKMGSTPSDQQIRIIVSWLNLIYTDCAGVATDNLPDAVSGSVICTSEIPLCGMAAVRIHSDYVLLWFRSHMSENFELSGVKQQLDDLDEGKRMHPRSSFNFFKEVVQRGSSPWKEIEINAIHSLQVSLRNTLNDAENEILNATAIQLQLKSLNGQVLRAIDTEIYRLIETAMVPVVAVDRKGLIIGWNNKIAELIGLHGTYARGTMLNVIIFKPDINKVQRILDSAKEGTEKDNIHIRMITYGLRYGKGPIRVRVNACAICNHHGKVVRVCFVINNITAEWIVTDKFVRTERLERGSTKDLRLLCPPTFGANKNGRCSEWNQAMTELSGWGKEEVIGKILLGQVFGTLKQCCRLKDEEAMANLCIAVNNAISCQEPESFVFSFFARSGHLIECVLCVSKKLDGEGSDAGTISFLQHATRELRNVLHFRTLPEQSAAKRMETAAYVKRQVRNALAGIIHAAKMLEGNSSSEEHTESLRICQLQLNKILQDTENESMIDGYLKLEMSEFTLHEVLVASLSQVMNLISEKSINVVNDIADTIMSEKLYGDDLRLQQVLADFLLTCVTFTPNGGHHNVSASLIKNNNTERSVQPTALRITHTGSEMPEELLWQMMGRKAVISEEGTNLFVSRKIVKLMNGDVAYLKNEATSTCIISAQFAQIIKPEG